VIHQQDGGSSHVAHTLRVFCIPFRNTTFYRTSRTTPIEGVNMTTSSIVLIVLVAVAAIVLIAAIAWVARNKRNQHRRVVADRIREAAKEDTLEVKQREALADETAAKARAAQAEADVKAAQASGLQQQAAAHRGEAATARDELNQQLARADKMDPASRTPETPRTAGRKEHQDH
jgi:FtsZ-interacting cell division protein ZipA